MPGRNGEPEDRQEAAEAEELRRAAARAGIPISDLLAWFFWAQQVYGLQPGQVASPSPELLVPFAGGRYFSLNSRRP